MQSRTRGDPKLLRGLLVGHLPPAEDQPLLRRRDARLLLYLVLDPGDLIIRINIELNLFPG